MSSIAKPTVLVTRPQPGSDETARRLEALGIDPVLLPFTEMVKLPNSVEESLLNACDAVAVTSANALRHMDVSLRDQLRHLPIFAVGDATSKYASDLGFSDVRSADGSAKDLVENISENLTLGSHLFYLCGQTRTDDVEMGLRQYGFETIIVETYATKKVSQLTHKMVELLKRHRFDAVLLYSSISARIFDELMEQIESQNLHMIPMVFCISERTKSALSVSLQDRAMVSAKPRDDAMIEMVTSYFHAN